MAGNSANFEGVEMEKEMSLGEILRMKLGAAPAPEPERDTWRAQILMWKGVNSSSYGEVVWEGCFKESRHAKKALRKAQKTLAPLWQWRDHQQCFMFKGVEYRAEMFVA